MIHCSLDLVRLLHYINLVTPLDVVKIRLQAQTKGFVKGECFLYCNGLMDHVCKCLNGHGSTGPHSVLWRRLPHEQLNGMIVCCHFCYSACPINPYVEIIVCMLFKFIFLFTVYHQLWSILKGNIMVGSIHYFYWIYYHSVM